MLQDRDFGKHGLARAHMNPAAQLATTLKTYEKYTLLKAYTGETFFWALSPKAGDIIDFKFNPAILIEKWVEPLLMWERKGNFTLLCQCVCTFMYYVVILFHLGVAILVDWV